MEINCMYTLYHNPKCSKSRSSLEYLKNNNIIFEVVDYLSNPLSKDELFKLSSKLDGNVLDIIRKGDDLFKQHLSLCDDLTIEKAIEIIVNEPKLMQRPILSNTDKAIIGRPLENIISFVN